MEPMPGWFARRARTVPAAADVVNALPAGPVVESHIFGAPVKFAFVTPRYGADIGTGIEHACRLIAEHVCERHDVDVLTTCARDHRTWKNEYSEGSDRVRGVLVRRFGVSQVPDHIGFDALSQRLYTSPHSRAEELEWVRLHGPWSPGLIEYLKRSHRSYDVLVFFGLLHPLTVHGLEIAPERTVLFPYLQLQPALRFGLWPDLVGSVRGLGFFSESERRLLHSYVGVRHNCEEVVGIGVDPPPQQAYPRHQQDPNDAILDEDDPAPTTTLTRRSISPAAAFRSSGAIASMAGSRCMAAASSRTTAVRKCSSTSTPSLPRRTTRRSC